MAYWKDIRRILFAENEFTMLCRLSKSGIQNDWNPIKAADIFKEFAPDLAKQIELASRSAMQQSISGHRGPSIEPAVAKLHLALVRYQDKLLEKIDYCLAADQRSQLDLEILSIHFDFTTAEGQRAAFATAKAMVERLAGVKIDPVVDLELRKDIRMDFDIPLFPEADQGAVQIQEGGHSNAQIEDANLLDVEVVAIYW